MLDWKDMERLNVLARKADRSQITPAEKGEMRGLMSKGTPTAWDFAWDDLVDIAFVWLGVYTFTKLGAQAAAASAS